MGAFLPSLPLSLPPRLLLSLPPSFLLSMCIKCFSTSQSLCCKLGAGHNTNQKALLASRESRFQQRVQPPGKDWRQAQFCPEQPVWVFLSQQAALQGRARIKPSFERRIQQEEQALDLNSQSTWQTDWRPSPQGGQAGLLVYGWTGSS